MRLQRWMTGLGIGVLCATGAIVAPSLQAQENGRDRVLGSRPAVAVRGGIGTFTPASADPRLAAMLSRAGIPDSGFRFTPSESRSGANRAVTVAVRARTSRGGQNASAITPSLSLAPVAYNLGVSVGWKRFAVTGDMAKVDLVAQPGSRERAALGVSYNGKRIGAKVEAISDKPLPGTSLLLADQPSQSVDVGGAFSVTRNLALTAGVRYKSEDQRLRLADNRRDSQAVYVGTAFRF